MYLYNQCSNVDSSAVSAKLAEMEMQFSSGYLYS